MSGPLTGTRVIELAAQGPAPFTGMLLADLGAEVISVGRTNSQPMSNDAHWRGRRSISLNLKDPSAVEVFLALVKTADAVIEGFRPGVTERLGIGPEECMARNPALIYGRVTGWGQDGPLAQEAGHDLNYLAASGALHSIGNIDGPPVPPLNLVADYGGGGMLLALGVVAALDGARRTGTGQVVDAAMIDGVAAMLAPFHGMSAAGYWIDQRGVNLLDGGAPFYSVYETADGKWLSIAAIEPQFYAELLARLDLDPHQLPKQMDQSGWPNIRAKFAEIFLTRSRDAWAEQFHGSQACMQPVLTMKEATEAPHAQARNMFSFIGGVPHPAPVPRFSATPLDEPVEAEALGTSTSSILADIGLDAAEIDRLRKSGAVQ